MSTINTIISNLKKLANDGERIEYLVDDNNGNYPSLIHEQAENYPKNVLAILNTLKSNTSRTFVMTFHDKKKASPLDILDGNRIGKKIVPAVLKFFPAKDRLAFIRREDSAAKEFTTVDKAKFKFINNIIFCDIYIEHLEASLSEKSHCNRLFAPD